MKFKVKSILFLGVGGISMHQLALAFKQMGVNVYGYDAKESKYLEICKQNGIQTTNKFRKDFCMVDLCVKTPAIKDDNKYVKALNSLNIKIVDRAEMLGWICTQFKQVIAVAGTHGKSTTASLIYEILRVAGKKVSCHIGADVFAPRFNVADEYLVVEACEYNKSFLKLHPNISVVTNIEAEHMDSYKSLFQLRSAFITFLKRANKRYVFKSKSTQFLNKYKSIDFVSTSNLKFSPKIKGDYNLKNIYLAAKVCADMGVSDTFITKAVNSFIGIPRRYEHIGNIQKTKIYIDYAHHPTEIAEFIKVFNKEFPNCLIVFQPHTYSRTKIFLNEFIKVLSSIKNLVIYKEYSARENISQGVSAKELWLKVKEINPNVQFCVNTKKLAQELNNYSAVAFVGAGDINLVAQKLIR